MRPVVVLAAIGAAALLGGVVGGAVVRATARPPTEPRDLNRERLDAHTDDLVRKTDDLRAKMDVLWREANDARWWCLHDNCLRTEAGCRRLLDETKTSDVDTRVCAPQRIAYCPAYASALIGQSCQRTVDRCMERLDSVRQQSAGAYCIGVE